MEKIYDEIGYLDTSAGRIGADDRDVLKSVKLDCNQWNKISGRGSIFNDVHVPKHRTVPAMKVRGMKRGKRYRIVIFELDDLEDI